jgi:hypothetical protein
VLISVGRIGCGYDLNSSIEGHLLSSILSADEMKVRTGATAVCRVTARPTALWHQIERRCRDRIHNSK